jgi:mitochondrial chaperone BCS1
VLVVTTNHPEKLDDALVRPGRVDMKIKFPIKDSTKMTILEMAILRRSNPIDDTNAASNFAKLSPCRVSHRRKLAAIFAEALPEAVFSLAEIQGFLLTQKKDPLKAVREVGAG